MTQPVVVVGNRMLGIIALAAGVIAVTPVAARFGPSRYAVAAVAVLVALRFLLRRVELAEGEVRWRTTWRFHRSPSAALVDVELDHRFLTFRACGHRRIRVEVPAESRPEVRRWADAARHAGGSR